MEFLHYRYILPNHMLLQICGILPREKQGILACCNPIPPLVRQYLNEIHAVIVKARESPLHKVSDIPIFLQNTLSGPGCSKLTTLLVNISLNFQKLISLLCQYFC